MLSKSLLSEPLLRQIIESSEQGFGMLDRDRRIVYANAKTCRMFGYTKVELVGRDVFELLHESSRNLMSAAFGKSKQGVREQLQISGLRKNGSTFWLQISASPHFDEEGNYQGSVAFLTDITAQKELELRLQASLAEQQARLRESEARREMLQTILDHLTDGVIAYDLEGHLILANSVARQHIGGPPEKLHEYRTEDLIERVKVRLLDGSPLKPGDSTTQRVLRGENIVHLDVITQKLGTERDTFSRNTSVALRDREGKLSGVITVMQDTTEKTLAEREKNRLLQELTSQKELLQGILDNIEDAVYVVRLDGTLQIANQKGFQLMGLAQAPEPPIQIKDIPSLMSIRDLEGNPIPPNALTVARAAQSEKSSPLISVMRIPGTTKDIFTQSSSTPLDPSSGQRAVVVIRDVSQFIELDRMKDQFIRVAAHELKTPVTLVKMNAEILPKTLENSSERQKTILRHLVQGSEKIDRITRDLLDLSQIQLDRIWFNQRNFDLGELLRETIARWQKPDAKHSIHLHQPKVPIRIAADRDRLEQVIDHLIDNAIKYSPAGGDIHVTLGVKDSNAILTVQDHGIGIPEHKQSHVFERFYRAHTDTPLDAGGLGIGLFLSHEIVTRLGGQIQFENKEGQGTWFSVSLPRLMKEDK